MLFVKKKTVECLGWIVSEKNKIADSKQIQAVIVWPIPSSKKEIMSFTGFVNCYRILIKEFATIAKPLYQATEKNIKFYWSD